MGISETSPIRPNGARNREKGENLHADQFSHQAHGLADFPSQIVRRSFAVQRSIEVRAVVGRDI